MEGKVKRRQLFAWALLPSDAICMLATFLYASCQTFLSARSARSQFLFDEDGPLCNFEWTRVLSLSHLHQFWSGHYLFPKVWKKNNPSTKPMLALSQSQCNSSVRRRTVEQGAKATFVIETSEAL